jgi:hypothetical protein
MVTDGRKRGIITESLGLLFAVIVTAAAASDNAIGTTCSTKPPPSSACRRVSVVKCRWVAERPNLRDSQIK